jgi:hypothetical protein
MHCLHSTDKQDTDLVYSQLARVIALPTGAMDEYGVTDGYSTSTPQKPTFFDGHYLRNHSTLDIGVLGYIGII